MVSALTRGQPRLNLSGADPPPVKTGGGEGLN